VQSKALEAQAEAKQAASEVDDLRQATPTASNPHPPLPPECGSSTLRVQRPGSPLGVQKDT
jgi:hypothetical protein